MEPEILRAAGFSTIGLDMSERVEENYRLESGSLISFPFRCDIPDWDQATRARRIAEFNAIIAEGGLVLEARIGETTAGIASVPVKRFSGDRLRLYTLHVDARHRGKGVGKALLAECVRYARTQGAAALYITASPKKATVDFYLGNGARLVESLDPGLFDEEPEDIHLEIPLSPSRQTP